ncbi:MAG: hypothetical protein J3Q66DRAFT_406562 [Benniella sp.]|nr:MAG: hypothetical protein J3Q66DRAFT_406562 [Benniella sp.]
MSSLQGLWSQLGMYAAAECEGSSPDQELHAGFGSLASVRKHMNDKGHCKLAMEPGAEREYADFYLPLLDDQAGDLEEGGHDTKESIGDSSMDADDSLLDEDQRKLNSVLLDEEGNWILDSETSAASGITIDPSTNELVLNKRRLTHKDAVRRQRLDARTGALTLRSEAGKPTDPHHPTVKASEDLLRSQNQLSGSSLALTKAQLSQVAVKTASAQHYESSKRERMATKLAVNNNISTRANVDSTYGFKV